MRTDSSTWWWKGRDRYSSHPCASSEFADGQRLIISSEAIRHSLQFLSDIWSTIPIESSMVIEIKMRYELHGSYGSHGAVKYPWNAARLLSIRVPRTQSIILIRISVYGRHNVGQKVDLMKCPLDPVVTLWLNAGAAAGRSPPGYSLELQSAGKKRRADSIMLGSR